jgi:hypothetical protein
VSGVADPDMAVPASVPASRAACMSLIVVTWKPYMMAPPEPASSIGNAVAMTMSVLPELSRNSDFRLFVLANLFNFFPRFMQIDANFLPTVHPLCQFGQIRAKP